ncbi:MAG TPA: DinB family protein [Chryseosolibacter sp.]|nr:DinB family protein [Chryseosolibacter sp.]
MMRFLSIPLLISGLWLDTTAQSIDSLFVSMSHSKLQSARAYTLEVARLMPPEHYSFRPDDDEMSFGEQLLHLSQNLGWLSSYYLNKKAENPVTKGDIKLQDKDSIIAVVSKAYDYALGVLKDFPPGRLRDKNQFFAGPMNQVQIITLLNDHQTHHRGQLIVYLRMKKIRPPAYVGW